MRGDPAASGGFLQRRSRGGRFRRRALDRARIDRARRARARDHRGAHEPLLEPGTLRLRAPAARHDARGLRRPRHHEAAAGMIVLVMGVAGVGKTTIGEALARARGWRFIDADDYHPPENVGEMKTGVPLQDADRWPWLARLNKLLKEEADAVLACSAQKESYRQRLLQGIHHSRIVYLHGGADLIRSRMAARQHRYMPASLLESQFATLEPPVEAIAIDVAATPEQNVAQILAALP